MRISFEGREYEWDPTVMTVDEAIFLEEKAGIGISEFNSAITLGRGKTLAVLVYLAKRRAGEAIRWQDMGPLNLATYSIVPDPAPESGEVRPDPTSPDGENPEPDTSATS